MNKTLDSMKLIGLFIISLIVLVIFSGFYINRQNIPPLNEIVPITKNINSTREIFVPARGSWNWIDLRLTNTPVQFAINGGNMIDSNTEVYQSIRRTLPVGHEITLWAIPKGPTLSEAFFFTSINRKSLHELDFDKAEHTNSSLGNFQEIKKVNYDYDVLTYDVVQIVMNGKTILPYNIYTEKKLRTDQQNLWFLIAFGLLVLIIGLILIFRLFSNTKSTE